MIKSLVTYLLMFGISLAVTLVLTPCIRELNRKLGMVDVPDKRRINKIPVPRGGGLAVVLGVIIPYLVFLYFSGCEWFSDLKSPIPIKLSIIALLMALLGYADDKFSLRPLVKLIGQIVLAFLVWGWVDVGFSGIWPTLPAALDCFMTVFWIVGAVNAFNLIDGMDGLATGLAFIATLGMAGSLFFVDRTESMLAYFAFMGGLLGFLRYNFNPASVFLGDCGSMFIGFTVSTLPLVVNAPNSFLVSVGVPLLAMGVPIFDTSLAIVRRSIRHALGRHRDAGNGRLMTADTDHLHHRILRSAGMNQRRAAFILYALSTATVVVGLVAMWLESSAGGLWLLFFTLGAVVVFRDMAKIEIFDAGSLLNAMAHDVNTEAKMMWRRLSVPFFVVIDAVSLVIVLLFSYFILGADVDSSLLRTDFTVRIAMVFVFLILMRVYSTVWSRAMPSNFMRLFFACVLGSATGSAAIYYIPGENHVPLVVMTISFATLSFLALMTTRVFRVLARDMYFTIACSNLKARKDVSRILVYGAGLRYRYFLRELIRATAANNRVVMGIIDDDTILRGRYIGEVKVLGTIAELKEIVNATNADMLVAACVMDDEKRKALEEAVKEAGIRMSEFSIDETEDPEGGV